MLPQTQEIERLTTEIIFFKYQTAENMIEVGRRLIQVKGILPHGEWENWLSEKVDFSSRTASNFMRAATEFPNRQSISDLTPSKVLKLLDLPPEDREEFIQQPQQLPSGETKTVQAMSTRELQDAIKGRKEAERQTQEAEQKIKSTNEQMVSLISEVQRLNTKVAEIPKQVIVEVAVIPNEIQEKASNADILSKTVDRLQKQNADMKFQLDSAKTPTDDTMELSAKVDRFAWRINQFLGEMGALAYVGGQYMRATDYSQLAYEKSLNGLEKWIHEVRESMQGSRYNVKNESEVIDL